MLNPAVRNFISIPLIINILVFGGLFYYFAQYGYQKLSFISDVSLPSWLHWLSTLLSVIQKFIFLLYIGILVSTFTMIATLCANLIAAPFNGLLSEAYAKKVLKQEVPSEPFLTMVWHSIKRELKKLLYYILRGIVVLVLAAIFYFIPGLNLCIPLLFLWLSSWMLAVEYIDYPADNQLVSFKELKVKMKQNKMLLLGFGLTLTGLSAIPVVNLFVMPSAVLGATKLWHQDMIGSPLS